MDIDAQIQNLMQELDQEAQREKELLETSKTTAMQLQRSGKIVTTIQGKVYTLSYKQTQQSGQLIAIDHTRLAIAGFHYKPAIFDIVFDKNFTEFENLEKLVQTFYYYKHGMIQPEDLEEEGDSL